MIRQQKVDTRLTKILRCQGPPITYEDVNVDQVGEEKESEVCAICIMEFEEK